MGEGRQAVGGEARLSRCTHKKAGAQRLAARRMHRMHHFIIVTIATIGALALGTFPAQWDPKLGIHVT